MTIKTLLQSRPLLCYFSLAYAITWGGILLVAGLKGFDPGAIELTDGLVMFLFMILGPSLSSLLLTALLEGKAGLGALFRRMAYWRLGWRAYLPLLTVPLISSAIFLSLAAVVSPAYKPNLNILFGLLIGGLAGFFEETGWTGFALPRLLARHSPLRSGLILGLLWATWHIMADFWGNFASYGALWLPNFLIYWLVPLTAYRILMAYVYRRTNSLLLGQLMHTFYTGTLIAISPSVSIEQGLLWEAIFAATLVAAATFMSVRAGRAT